MQEAQAVFKIGIFFHLTLFVCCRSSVDNAEGVLIKQLLTDYDTDVKPTLDPLEPINVSLAFFLTRLENLDERNQVLNSFGFIAMMWTDAFLQWDPSLNGVPQFVTQANRVWLPEIAPENSVEEGTDISQDTKFRVSVTFNGTVFWGPSFKWRTYCKVNLETFPFDTQSCNVTFINWIYSLQNIRFVVALDEVELALYSENGEWDLIGSRTFTRVQTLSAYDTSFPLAGFEIKLRRKPTYFVLNVIVPSIILSMASLLVFCLPVESGEKVSLSITIMLSYTVLLLVISDITPRTGSGQPFLAYYMVGSMATTAFSLITTVAVLSLFYQDPKRPVPNWLKKLTMTGLISFESKNKVSSSETILIKPKLNENSEIQKEKEMKEEVEVMDPKLKQLSLGVMNYFDKMAEKECDIERIENTREEWIKVAMVVNRFSLLLTIVFVVGLTLFLFIRVTL